jgi:tetratricopeptide (TPR) repeat protein
MGGLMKNDDPQTQRRFWLVALALAALTAAIYSAVLGHEFISFDDADYVTQNPRVFQGLSVRSVIWAFTGIHACNWHPLTTLTHLLDCQLFQLNPAGHHFTNLVLHTANTVLLFAALRRLTGAFWRSAIVAALFAWHPLHVESVAWVSERKDVLCGLFWMLGLLLYADYARQPSRRRYLWLLACFAAGLLSKPMMVTFPCVLLLLDFWPLRRFAFAAPAGADAASGPPPRSWKFLVVEKIPFFLLTAAASATTFLIQHLAGATVSLTYLPVLRRAANAVVAYATYLRKMIWPHDLAIFYPHRDHFPPALLAGAALLLLALTALALWRWRRQPYLLVGWLWFLGTLFPVIGLIQVGNQSLADRYTYLPLIGIFVALTWGGAELAARWPRCRPALAGAVGVLLAGCLALTHFQLQTWRDSIQLFSHALAVTKDNFVARDNLGTALNAVGRTDEAIKHIQQAIQLAPGAVFPLNNLGWIYAQQGKYEAARELYEAALRLKPDFRQVYNNLGLLAATQERWEEAIQHYETYLRFDPERADVHYRLGAVLVRVNRLEEALKHFELALKYQPEYAEVESQIGGVYHKLGQVDAAIEHYARAVRLAPTFAHARVKLGLLFAQRLRLEDARVQLTYATQLEPTNDAAFYNLAGVYQVQGRLAEAVAAFNKVLELKPTDADARSRLGDIYTQTGQFDLALAQYQEALRLRPDAPRTLNGLAYLRATAPQPPVRDAAEAVRLAERSTELTRRQDLEALTVLDQAYAAAGRFEEAIKVALELQQLAQSTGRPVFAEQAERRLEAYRAGRFPGR